MSEVTSQVELNDSEILKVESLIQELSQKYTRRRIMVNDFDQEARERFAKIGLRVKINWYETNLDDVYLPEISIEERIEGEFDPDQQVWEATRDILELGEEGVIKTSGLIVPGKKNL